MCVFVKMDLSFCLNKKNVKSIQNADILSEF